MYLFQLFNKSPKKYHQPHLLFEKERKNERRNTDKRIKEGKERRKEGVA